MLCLFLAGDVPCKDCYVIDRGLFGIEYREDLVMEILSMSFIIEDCRRARCENAVNVGPAAFGQFGRETGIRGLADHLRCGPAEPSRTFGIDIEDLSFAIDEGNRIMGRIEESIESDLAAGEKIFVLLALGDIADDLDGANSRAI